MTASLEREDDDRGPLDVGDVDPDPIIQFQRWFEEAVGSGESEPEAMVLATVNAAGYPSARVVLLRGVDETGFYFYTNYQSPKARDITANAQVALVLHWHKLERQVRVTGHAVQAESDRSDAYFRTRPRGSQIGAWASEQGEVIASRQVLVDQVRAIEERMGDGPIPRPPFWGGYRVIPERIELWQGRLSRLHDRLRYRRQDSRWIIERLSP